MSRLIVVLLSLAALGALAGCGASDSVNPGVVAQAADKTASAGGMRLAMTVSSQGQTLNGDGFFDPKGRKGRISLNLPQGNGTMDMVFLSRVIYMHLPDALTKQIPGGKSWLKVDLEKALKAKGIDLGALQSTSSNDPAQQLDQLRGAGDVKKVGSEKVRGTDTTHYKATIDLRKAADRAPAAQRDAARRSVESVIKLTGQSTIPLDAWLDQQGRARRIAVKQTVGGHSVAETMDLYDFGAREAIKAPPASETKDVISLAAKAGPNG
jgi:hypothetical protein